VLLSVDQTRGGCFRALRLTQSTKPLCALTFLPVWFLSRRLL